MRIALCLRKGNQHIFFFFCWGAVIVLVRKTQPQQQPRAENLSEEASLFLLVKLTHRKSSTLEKLFTYTTVLFVILYGT